MRRSLSEMDKLSSDVTAYDMDADAEADRMVTALESATLEAIRFVGVQSASRRPGDIDSALNGRFRLGDQRFRLSPPVDWWREPYGFPGERGFFQNSFTFADPLLIDDRYAEVLEPLAQVFADWLSANPRENAEHEHRYAWHDHAAAGRIVAMAFVLREGVRLELLGSSLARTLAAGVLEHAEYLLADENYAAQHNHGFASDAALALAARSVAPAPRAEEWRRIAERRLAAILVHMIDCEEAIHLEHSPQYHWIIHGALSRLAAVGLFEDLELRSLATRMEESGAWLTAPDGTLPPIGDTPSGLRPTRAASATLTSLSGMRVFRSAGYAVVRDGDSALILTAAHHPTAHKHADDGSFCLYEAGLPIVMDSGCPGYEYDSPEFRYGTSPAAHATICVDGFDWTREMRPYGSGIVAAARADDLYGLMTCNPGAVPGGGGARRILVYRPGRFLLVLDDTDTDTDNRVVRTLPLAPGLEARSMGDGVEISRAGAACAGLLQLSGPQAPSDEIELHVGVRTPEMRGFRFPTPDESLASCDLALVGRGGHLRGYALIPGQLEGRAAQMHRRDLRDSTSVEIAMPREPGLRIDFSQSSLALDVRS